MSGMTHSYQLMCSDHRTFTYIQQAIYTASHQHRLKDGEYHMTYQPTVGNEPNGCATYIEVDIGILFLFRLSPLPHTHPFHTLIE